MWASNLCSVTEDEIPWFGFGTAVIEEDDFFTWADNVRVEGGERGSWDYTSWTVRRIGVDVG